MTRKKMRIGWKQIVVDGWYMHELVSVDGVANQEDLPKKYIAGDEYVDSCPSESGFSFYVHGMSDHVLKLDRSYKLGDRITAGCHCKLVLFLRRCAENLRRIDKEINTVPIEGEDPDWNKIIVDEI